MQRKVNLQKTKIKQQKLEYQNGKTTKLSSSKKAAEND